MPTRPLAAKNVQLMTEGEVLQFHNRPTAESARKHRAMERTKLSMSPTVGSGAVYMSTCPTRTPYYSCGIIAAALEDLSVLYALTPNLASSSVPTNV